MSDVGVELVVPETGTTFEENATLKAISYARMTGLVAMADDSGLEIDVLGGEPGVFSSRYAGVRTTDAKRIEFLLHKLYDFPEEDLSARFRCVIAIARPDGLIDISSGECVGKVIKIPRGENGFGYDPIFLIPGLNRTLAELTQEEKNSLSHRAKAAQKINKIVSRETLCINK